MLMTRHAAAAIRNDAGHNRSAFHRTFMIHKDGQPFLLVNGTTEKVLEMVAGFRMRSNARWDMLPQE
jgi:hypothetical protein